MDQDIRLRGEEVTLRCCTNRFWHMFYKHYINDPMMSEFPYVYDYERVEQAYHAKAADQTRRYFSILKGETVVGEIYWKHINPDEGTAELGIALIDDSVKGRGYGTEAIQLLVAYAFYVLGMKCVLADCVLRNTRSQHVLEKAGFIYTHEDTVFRYYRCERRGDEAQEDGR